MLRLWQQMAPANDKLDDDRIHAQEGPDQDMYLEFAGVSDQHILP
jgi:hypothetical protein